MDLTMRFVAVCVIGLSIIAYFNIKQNNEVDENEMEESL